MDNFILMENINLIANELEKEIEILNITKGDKFSYKIFDSNADICSKEWLEFFHKNIKIWSAIYPQQNIDSALNYLPNYFERPFSKVSLYMIKAIRDIRVIKFKNKQMGEGLISTETKANILISAILKFFELKDKKEINLMDLVGEKLKSILYILDKDEFEYVVPLSMFNEDNLELDKLADFDLDLKNFKIKRFSLLNGDAILINDQLSDNYEKFKEVFMMEFKKKHMNFIDFSENIVYK